MFTVINAIKTWVLKQLSSLRLEFSKQIGTKADASTVKQSDWGTSDLKDMAYIKNKPFGFEVSRESSDIYIDNGSILNSYINYYPDFRYGTEYYASPGDTCVIFLGDDEYYNVPINDNPSPRWDWTIGDYDFIEYPFVIVGVNPAIEGSDEAGRVSIEISQDYIDENQPYYLEIDFKKSISITHIPPLFIPPYGLVRAINISGNSMSGDVYLDEYVMASRSPHGTGELSMNGGSVKKDSKAVALGAMSTANGDSALAIGYGSSSLNCSANGNGSFAHGTEGVSASGYCSTAMGRGSSASADCAIANGYKCRASNYYSAAFGYQTTASGERSFAEGVNAVSSGTGSHAEGSNTIASANYSHAQGKFNMEDTAKNFAHIVGNGASASSRSNAHTLDWSGNAWFAGDVYVGSTSGKTKDAGSKKLATEDYVKTLHSNVTINQQLHAEQSTSTYEGFRYYIADSLFASAIASFPYVTFIGTLNDSVSRTMLPIAMDSNTIYFRVSGKDVEIAPMSMYSEE